MYTVTVTAVLIISLMGLVAGASVSDWHHHRIPNLLTLGGAGWGVLLHILSDGTQGLLFAIGGWAVGFACLWPGYLMGQMGAGDVKLLAAVGTFLGPLSTLMAGAVALVAGATVALLVACVADGEKPWGRYASMFRHLWTTGQWSYLPPTGGEVVARKFPFAPAIATGTVVGAWHHLAQFS